MHQIQIVHCIQVQVLFVTCTIVHEQQQWNELQQLPTAQYIGHKYKIKMHTKNKMEIKNIQMYKTLHKTS